MGFNYLQTDDRDDYFLTLWNKNKFPKQEKIYNIIKDDKIIFTGNTLECKIFCKKTFKVEGRFVKKGKWRDLLIQNNCKIK